MKKAIVISLLITLAIVFCSLFSEEIENFFKSIRAHPVKVTRSEKYFPSYFESYQWIDPKDEKSLINKMNFQKILISPAKEENPSTVIKVLNFSRKSYKELDIHNPKNPLYYFSEKYIAGPVYLYTIKDATIFFGEDTRKFLVFKSGFYTSMGGESDSIGRIIPKLTEKEDIYYLEKTNEIYSAKTLTTLSSIKDKTILFHGDCNLYHTIMETSPGLLLMNDNDYKATLSFFSKHNTDILEEIGNPSIVPTKLFSFKKFSELIIPSFLLENNAHLPNMKFMNVLIKKLQINLSEKAKVRPLGKRIYVSRSDASRRKILNEAELIKHLSNRDFTIVTPGKYSVADQSKLFKEAEIIMGPHGLGLINMIYADDLKVVIELFSTAHYPNCYLRTAQIKGAKNYYGLIHNAEESDTNWLSDYKVNIPEILKVLDIVDKSTQNH